MRCKYQIHLSTESIKQFIFVHSFNDQVELNVKEEMDEGEGKKNWFLHLFFRGSHFFFLQWLLSHSLNGRVIATFPPKRRKLRNSLLMTNRKSRARSERLTWALHRHTVNLRSTKLLLPNLCINQERGTKKSLRWSPGVIIMLAFFYRGTKISFLSSVNSIGEEISKKNKHHSRVPRNIFRLLDVRLLSQRRNLFLNIFSSFPFILFELKNSRIFVFFFRSFSFHSLLKAVDSFLLLLSTAVARR